MIPRRVLTVCVGLSDYPAQVLKPGEAPLRFLAASARDLNALFQRVWPSSDSIHRLLVDADATLSGLHDLLTAAEGEYDLFILYLGGHGRAGRGMPFHFLFYGVEPEQAVAHAQDIDAVLERPKAASVLLLLDACYAGAYGKDGAFVRSAGQEGSHLCIASSGADQKSWEDKHFKRSLFADAIAKALTDPAIRATGSKRVAAEFFDAVAADVARHAFALKGSAPQEPVLIGISDAEFSLPTVEPSATAVKSMTTYQVLVRRSRQIALAAAVLGVTAAVGTSCATWRPALNGSGNVELRPGPKWLSPLNIGFWQRRVETDITTSDLKDEDVRAELLDERGLRPWPGLNKVRVRRWADTFIDDYLNMESAARWRVRLGYENALERLSNTTHRIVPIRTATVASATELAAEAKLLQPSAPLDDVWRLQWRNNVPSGGCTDTPLSQEQSDQLNFYLRLSEPADYAAWLHGLALTARADDAVGYEEVAKIVEMFTAANHAWRRDYAATVAAPGEPVTAARIAARFTERPTRSEVAGLAAVAVAVAARRSEASREPITSAERARVLGLMNGCADVAVYVLAVLGTHGDPALVVSWARMRAKSDQGRLPLRELASREALPDNAIVWVLDTLGFAGDPVDRKRAFVGAREWLTAIADVRPLPESLVNRLIEYAADRLMRGDGEGSRQAVAVIVRAAVGAHAASDPRYSELLAASGEARGPLPPTEPELELTGLLARSGATLSLSQRDALMTVLGSSAVKDRPRVSFIGEDKNGVGKVTQLVSGLTLTHLLAFSRFVIGSNGADGPARDPRSLPFLQKALADGLKFGVRPDRLGEVAMAAAIALERSTGAQLDAASLRDELRCCSTDAANRRARIEIVCFTLTRMPRDRRIRVLEELRTYWRNEQEPEIKLALAAVILRGASTEVPASLRSGAGGL